jgi:hypothetical protein
LIGPGGRALISAAINAAEERLGELRVRACAAQAEQLLAWVHAWPERTWAVEGADGLGHLLAQLHAVLCELVPGGVPGEITAGQAARILASITPSGPVQAPSRELAAEFTEDLRGIDARIRDTRRKLAIAVTATGTSLTGLSGVGPVTTAAVAHRSTVGDAE